MFAAGVEPALHKKVDFKSTASTDSAKRTISLVMVRAEIVRSKSNLSTVYIYVIQKEKISKNVKRQMNLFIQTNPRDGRIRTLDALYPKQVRLARLRDVPVG